MVSQGHPLTVWETTIASCDGRDLTVHAVPIPLKHFRLRLAVHTAGQNLVWQDGIVRGLSPWDPSHMVEMNRVLRRSPASFLEEDPRAASVVAVLNGNGNLFWNMGHFAMTQGKLWSHFREELRGPQTVLVQDAGTRLAVAGSKTCPVPSSRSADAVFCATANRWTSSSPTRIPAGRQSWTFMVT